MAYPVEGEGVFCGSCNKQSYGFSSTSLSRKFTAWGNVGLEYGQMIIWKVVLASWVYVIQG